MNERDACTISSKNYESHQENEMTLLWTDKMKTTSSN